MNCYRDIAPYYDLELAGYEDDLDFYLRSVKAGPVLDVGVGTGRVFAPLAAAGFEVWGVDTSSQMLAIARDRLPVDQHAHLLDCAIEDLNVSTTFGAMILSLNFLWHLVDTESRVRALMALRRHAAPDALLLIDLTNPFTMADRGASGQLRERFNVSWGDGKVSCWSSAWDDEAAQILDVALYYDVVNSDGSLRRSQAALQLSYLYQRELELLLLATGFSRGHYFGSYELEPYVTTSPNLIAVSHPDTGSD